MKTYTVRYERDETGWWVASVKGVPGCHTQGRSIAQARSRISEALEATLPELKEVVLKDDIRLPTKVKGVLNQREQVQRRLRADQARAHAVTKKAVRALVRDLHLSVRDAGVVLGRSHQRVQQLIAE